MAFCFNLICSDSFWIDDSAVNMYILHSGNSLIWIQVIVNTYIKYKFKT